jgi:oligopeptide/dipeptide ABC transporter ATP-binding protein
MRYESDRIKYYTKEFLPRQCALSIRSREDVMSENLLHVENLRTYFFTHRGTVKAVDGVSFDLKKGEILGLVGETGCGKSVTGLSVMRLIPSPPGKIVGGNVIFSGEDLLKKSEGEMRRIRGCKVSMIFQEPALALNPLFTTGTQIRDVVRTHQEVNKQEALEMALEMMKHVGIPEPEKRLKQYPHELSGGMQQRIMIAMALSCQPLILIADEPTTALDVTIEAHIIRLIKELKEEFDMSVLFITHDLGVVATICSRVAVMYAGTIVEEAPILDFFENSKHPYTESLLKCIPRLALRGARLATIKGDVPSGVNNPSGCKFHPRCPKFIGDICVKMVPAYYEIRNGHYVACHLYD